MDATQRLLPMVQELQRQIRDATLLACSRRSQEELSQVADESPSDYDLCDRPRERGALDRALRGRGARRRGHRARRGGPRERRDGAARAARARERALPGVGRPDRRYARAHVPEAKRLGAHRHRAESRTWYAALGYRGRRPDRDPHSEARTSRTSSGRSKARARSRSARTFRPGSGASFQLRPSRATGIEHGFAMLTRFFHGGRDVLGEARRRAR